MVVLSTTRKELPDEVTTPLAPSIASAWQLTVVWLNDQHDNVSFGVTFELRTDSTGYEDCVSVNAVDVLPTP